MKKIIILILLMLCFGCSKTQVGDCYKSVEKNPFEPVRYYKIIELKDGYAKYYVVSSDGVCVTPSYEDIFDTDYYEKIPCSEINDKFNRCER